MRKQTPPFFISFFYLNASLGKLDYPFYKCKSKTVALCCTGAVALIELIKYLRAFTSGAIDGPLSHISAEIFFSLRKKLHAYLSALRGELDSVVDDILPYLRHKFLTAHIHDILKVDIKVDFFSSTTQVQAQKYFSYLLVKKILSFLPTVF